jgi:hypothetical protein
MTAQVPEQLRYEGEDGYMLSLPLWDYFSMSGQHPPFHARHTANRRGYVGEWEIRDHRLYLIGLHGTLKDGTEVTLETVFPGFGERVFAKWFSGTLRVPQGDMVRYMHLGFGSLYAIELFLQIEQGVVVGKREERNTAKKSRGWFSALLHKLR